MCPTCTYLVRVFVRVLPGTYLKFSWNFRLFHNVELLKLKENVWVNKTLQGKNLKNRFLVEKAQIFLLLYFPKKLLK